VLEQDQPAPRAQDPPSLRHGLAVIGNRAEGEGDDHRVEALVLQVERLRIAKAQVHVAPKLSPALASDLEHFRAELDPGQPDVTTVVGKVATCPDRDLEDFALDLRAGPIATAAEQDPLPEAHLAVIPSSTLVLDAADALRLTGEGAGDLSHREKRLLVVVVSAPPDDRPHHAGDHPAAHHDHHQSHADDENRGHVRHLVLLNLVELQPEGLNLEKAKALG
jgi:hypothetical protein